LSAIIKRRFTQPVQLIILQNKVIQIPNLKKSGGSIPISSAFSWDISPLKNNTDTELLHLG